MPEVATRREVYTLGQRSEWLGRARHPDLLPPCRARPERMAEYNGRAENCQDARPGPRKVGALAVGIVVLILLLSAIQATAARPSWGGTIGAGPRPELGGFPAAAETALLHTRSVSNATYPLAFMERGLPNRTAWVVNLSGISIGSSGPTIGFVVPIGTYTFTAQTLNTSGYFGLFGTVNVAGATSVNLSFYPVRGPPRVTCYWANFSEVGLPAGTNWSVRLTGTNVNMSLASTTSTIRFDCLDPGKYTFTPGTFAVGYTVLPSGGALNLTAASETVEVVFLQAPLLWASISIVFETGDSCQSQPVTAGYSGSAQGGVPPYRYAWNFEDGSPLAYGPNVSHTYYDVGPQAFNAVANLTVYDSAGQTAFAVMGPENFSCYTPPSTVSVSSPGFATFATIEVGGMVAAVLITALAVAFARRPPQS